MASPAARETLVVEAALSIASDGGVKNFASLSAMLHMYATHHRHAFAERDITFHALQVAIESFVPPLSKGSFDFYRDLLPKIWSFAVGDGMPLTLPVLRRQSGSESGVVQQQFTAAQVAFVLANAFFLNLSSLPVAKDCGVLDFFELYSRPVANTVAVQRILCQLAYFYQLPERSLEKAKEKTEAEGTSRVISFERHSSVKPNVAWSSSNVPITPLSAEHGGGEARIHLHTGSMESSSAPNFVDFANRRLQIHRMIASCTQEEVLFSVAPELQLCLLLIPTLDDDEVVVIRNVRRCSSYTGYLDSFCFAGLADPESPTAVFNVIAMDACIEHHFTSAMVERDLNKAMLGFAAVAEPAKQTVILTEATAAATSQTTPDAQAASRCRISTGGWGTGVFGNDPLAKFLQQVCVVAVLATCDPPRHIQLDYSTFHDQDMLVARKELLQVLEAKKITVGKIVQWMMQYGREARAANADTADSFDAWFQNKLTRWN